MWWWPSPTVDDLFTLYQTSRSKKIHYLEGIVLDSTWIESNWTSGIIVLDKNSNSQCDGAESPKLTAEKFEDNHTNRSNRSTKSDARFTKSTFNMFALSRWRLEGQI